VLIAGCGSGGGGSSTADAEKQIKAVIAKALITKDVEAECVGTVTKHFVATVYRTLAVCRKAEAKDDGSKPPTGAQASAIKVDGDKATADVKVTGGDTDGASGQIEFAKEDNAWKVDGISVAFLRAQARSSLSHDRGDALADPTARSCVSDGLDALSDDQLRTVAYDGIADRTNQAFLNIIKTCLSAGTSSSSGGDTPKDARVSVLRQQFEEGIRKSATADGTSKKAVDCVVTKLRAAVSDKELLDLIGKSKGESPPELTKAVASAMIDCNAT
jgi:hypothetical protein